jgi:hypothetical protein
LEKSDTKKDLGIKKWRTWTEKWKNQAPKTDSGIKKMEDTGSYKEIRIQIKNNTGRGLDSREIKELGHEKI